MRAVRSRSPRQPIRGGPPAGGRTGTAGVPRGSPAGGAGRGSGARREQGAVPPGEGARRRTRSRPRTSSAVPARATRTRRRKDPSKEGSLGAARARVRTEDAGCPCTGADRGRRPVPRSRPGRPPPGGPSRPGPGREGPPGGPGPCRRPCRPVDGVPCPVRDAPVRRSRRAAPGRAARAGTSCDVCRMTARTSLNSMTTPHQRGIRGTFPWQHIRHRRRALWPWESWPRICSAR